MKSNLAFVAFGVLCISFCIHSIKGRNLGYDETKFKRQVDPLPEASHVNDEQSQEKEEDIKVNDPSPSPSETPEYVETKRSAGEIEEEAQKRSDDPEIKETKVDGLPEEKPIEEAQEASAHVFMEAPAPVAQVAKQEVAAEVAPQATNKEEVFVNRPAEEKEEEKYVAELKPAASSVVPVNVPAPQPHHVQHKSYAASYWSRAAE